MIIVAITFTLIGAFAMAGLVCGIPLWRQARQDARGYWGAEVDGNNKVVQLGRWR